MDLSIGGGELAGFIAAGIFSAALAVCILLAIAAIWSKTLASVLPGVVACGVVALICAAVTGGTTAVGAHSRWVTLDAVRALQANGFKVISLTLADDQTKNPFGSSRVEGDTGCIAPVLVFRRPTGGSFGVRYLNKVIAGPADIRCP